MRKDRIHILFKNWTQNLNSEIERLKIKITCIDNYKKNY